MGQEDGTDVEFSEKSSLIDFLYVDKERIDSLISQIRNGTLRSVTKTIGTSEGSSMSAKLNTGIINGSYENDNKDNASAAERYDPYHSQLINLLNDLNLTSLSKLPSPCAGDLALIHSPITIRDIASMKAIIPAIIKNQSALGVKYNKDAQAIFKLMNDMIQQMPDSISLSINFKEEIINGTLKENGLSIKQDDLMRTYGVNLPDNWFTLGILDCSISAKADPTHVESIENAIDVYASAMSTLYSKSLYKIVPILIFREIKY